MSEAVPTAGKTPARTPGPWLRLERERQGLSVQKAADEMHLDTWVIDALETDTYTRLGPAVYAKGHLRKYAALLGLPPAEIVAVYESLQLSSPQPQTTRVRSLVPNSALHNIPWGRVAGVLTLVVVLFGVVWWQPWQQRMIAAGAKAATSGPTEAPPSEAAIPEPAPTAEATPDSLPTPTTPTPTPTTTPIPTTAATPLPATPPTAVSVPAATAASEAPVAQPAAVPESGAGHARLRMSFSADSWVDVRDATGKRVFSGNGRANSVKSLAGEAPLRVYLGFASGVQLEINERTVAIGPQFVNGDVARFEAGADGVLRRDSHAARPRG